jgi:hypothetical protein
MRQSFLLPHGDVGTLAIVTVILANSSFRDAVHNSGKKQEMAACNGVTRGIDHSKTVNCFFIHRMLTCG